MQVWEYLRGLRKKYNYIERQNAEPGNSSVDQNLGDQLGIKEGKVKKQLSAKVMKKAAEEANRYRVKGVR